MFGRTIVPALLLAATASAADWPQWLGPNRDGTIPDKIAPWKEDLKVLWRVAVGEGNSSPIVVGEAVYLHTKVKGREAERLQSFDVKTGQPNWDKSYDKAPFKPLFGEGPRATPAFASGKVYTFGNTGTLICWNAATGKEEWRVDVLENPKKDNPFFGISASPLIVGGNVVVQGGGAGSRGIKAYDRFKGKLAWNAGEDPASYASPVLIGDEIVALTGSHFLAVSPAGKVLWKLPFRDTLAESSTTPIKAGDTYVAASVTLGAIGVKVTEAGGERKAKQVWKNPALTCYFSTPIPVGKDHVYVVTGVASLTNPTVTLRCIETATGKEVWSRPKIGKYHAALLRTADGNVLMHDDRGDLHLLAPSVTGYESLATSKACGATWAHPAVSNGRIFLRDDKELVCLQLPGE